MQYAITPDFINARIMKGSVFVGDLGSDAGQSALSISAKVLEALLRLFEKLFEAWRNNPKRELTKIQLKEAKSELERQEILDKLQGKTGYVNYQDLKRSGMELEPIGIFMTKGEMKEFSALCKREGILFSGMTDSTEKNDSGAKAYEIICKKADLEKVGNIVDRMNDEKMIAGIENRIAELSSKGEAMTEQDKVDIAALQEQKEAIQRSYCDKLNVVMAQNVVDRAVTGEAQKSLTLDEALNRLTGRSIDKDVVCIVADANDPSKYIKCHGYQAEYNDKPYIKTDYEVYRGADCVLKTHDGRFDGRPEGYWNNQKAAIQEAGEFSGTFFKFYSVVEYQKWAEATRTQNEQELAPMSQEGTRDYGSIVKSLEEHLDQHNAALKDGVVVNKESGEPIALSEDMTEEEKSNVAEAIVIGKQINNYNELSNIEVELAAAKANVIIYDEGTPERAEADATLVAVQSRHDSCTAQEQQLLSERKEINAVQAEQEVREDRSEPALEEHRTSERGTGNRTNEAEHPDNRRSERVDDRDAKQMTMEEVKGQIEAQRAKDGAKGNDVKDRQANELEGKAATSKVNKSQPER